MQFATSFVELPPVALCLRVALTPRSECRFGDVWCGYGTSFKPFGKWPWSTVLLLDRFHLLEVLFVAKKIITMQAPRASWNFYIHLLGTALNLLFV